MKVKTTELIGPVLDWAVAMCERYDGLRNNPHAFNQALIMNRADGQCVLFCELRFSSNWSWGGPIIERERIGVSPSSRDGHRDEWAARIINQPFYYGPTPLIAAMRSYVSSKLGEEVDVPEELLK